MPTITPVEEADERELRQFRLMRDRLTEFRDGKIGLHRLVNDLEALLCALEKTPEPWCDQFRNAWCELDVSYGLAVDRGGALPGMNDHLVRESVHELDQLVTDRLRSF